MPPGMPFTAGFRALFETPASSCSRSSERPAELPSRSPKARRRRGRSTLDGGNPFEIELRRFVDCIAGQADPHLLDADRAIEALGLSLATQQALVRSTSIAL